MDVLGVKLALAGLRLDGMTDPLILEHVFTTHLARAPEPREAEAIMDAYVRYLPDEIATAAYHVKPHVPETLDALEARGTTIGLATGNLEAGARIKLTRGNLWHRFPFGGFGSDARDRAELVRVAIARGRARAGRDFARDEILVVGDTPRDVAAAHDAGARAIGVATGGHTAAELRACGADEVYETLAEWRAPFQPALTSV
jgi:phosphoglycolate phosphatase